MSPFLFALGMEYLSRCLNDATSSSGFKFHPRCKKLLLTHMMFVDDLLMFVKVERASKKIIFDAFTKFSNASGLVAILHKSEVCIVGIPDALADTIVANLGISRGSFPFKYLGVPLTTRKLNFTDCKPLIEKTVARIRSKMLSYAGRIQLLCLVSNYSGARIL